MPNLKNKVVLITGANRGQGKSITEHLDFLGAKIAVGSRNFQDAISVSQSLTNKSIPIKLDITKEEDWKKAVNTILEEFGQIDILVNNAGVYRRQSFLESTLEEYEKLINVNQIGIFLGMKNVANQMKNQQQGSIINTVSISSFSPINQSSLYASTKAAVTTMSKAAAIELGDYGIRVNMVHPGGVDTGMFSESKGGNSFYDSIPLHRIGKPIDIAKAIAFFASDESSYCTGTELVVDGGMTLGTDA
ncbi:SDR family NAD(P)-dependent oxidoreductase [Staphylococcus xylosus]|uniref:SDR family NAD(P)-dependent oxidoreductase n=1 Tax=Staphylococcus xylosus TaxID=1288 RepID=UPI00034C1D04|nr:SDR family oxidoreductase [Staphylococcus xylosus]